MAQFVVKLLGEQRKRAVATVMNGIEAKVDGRLNPQEHRDLRDSVVGAINAYHDLCLDLLKASVNDGTEVNDEALRLIARTHQLLLKLEKP